MRARRFISSKIDALTSAASPARIDATAKEEHVNYDVSEVYNEARASRTTGRGCYSSVLMARRRVVESSIFPVRARGGRSAMIHPTDPIVHAGRVGMGLAKGGGVLLGWTTAYYLVEESQGVTAMKILSWRRGQNG